MSQGHDFSHDDERFEPELPRKAGMSSGKKALIILLSIFGGLLLLCCGGVVYVVSKIKNSASGDPAVVKQVTQEIVTIDIPVEYRPIQSVEMDLPIIPKIKMAVYQGATESTSLVLMEINVPAEDIEAQQDEMRNNMKEQGRGGVELENVEKLPLTEVTIQGQKVPFQFTKGNDPNTGKKIIQVQGVFKGKNGMIMLMLQVPEADYKRENIDKMLKSIK